MHCDLHFLMILDMDGNTRYEEKDSNNLKFEFVVFNKCWVQDVPYWQSQHRFCLRSWEASFFQNIAFSRPMKIQEEICIRQWVQDWKNSSTDINAATKGIKCFFKQIFNEPPLALQETKHTCQSQQTFIHTTTPLIVLRYISKCSPVNCFPGRISVCFQVTNNQLSNLTSFNFIE